jgi:hypothetical protein
MDIGDVKPIIDVARSISDVGSLLVITAFYLVITGTMMIIFIRWFVKMVNQIINTQQDNLKTILELQKTQDVKLNDIKGLLNSEMLNQIKILYSYAFDFHRLTIINIIKQIITENNLENREFVERKLNLSLKNLFDDCKSKFLNFSYNGKKLADYMEEKWLENVIQNCLNEIYKTEAFNEENTARHITLVFDSIKIEFQNNLLKNQ